MSKSQYVAEPGTVGDSREEPCPLGNGPLALESFVLSQVLSALHLPLLCSIEDSQTGFRTGILTFVCVRCREGSTDALNSGFLLGFRMFNFT